MLSEKMLARLNEQINLEFYSSNLYLQMSSWCESKGLEGCSTFLRSHATEEMTHMQRLFGYVNETGAMAILGQIDAPPTEYSSIVIVGASEHVHDGVVCRGWGVDLA